MSTKLQTGSTYEWNNLSEEYQKNKIEKKYNKLSNAFEVLRTGGILVGGVDVLYQFAYDAGHYNHFSSPKEVLTGLGIAAGSYIVGTALHKFNKSKREKALKNIEELAGNQ
jgi:hypothetical protein